MRKGLYRAVNIYVLNTSAKRKILSLSQFGMAYSQLSVAEKNAGEITMSFNYTHHLPARLLLWRSHSPRGKKKHHQHLAPLAAINLAIKQRQP
jgi:hypothetical protein